MKRMVKHTSSISFFEASLLKQLTKTLSAITEKHRNETRIQQEVVSWALKNKILY